MSSTAVPVAKRSFRWPGTFSSEHLVLCLSIVYFLVLWPFTPELASGENLSNLMIGMMPLLIVALGQMFVLITAGIDLSVTSIIGLASVYGAFAMNGDSGWLRGQPWVVPGGMAAILLTGALVGGINGFAVAVLRMPAFIVTLTTMMFGKGFAIWLTQSQNIANLPSAFLAIGGQAGIGLVLTIAAVGCAQAVLGRTLFGRWLYAVGHNPKAALISGVPVTRVIWLAYVVSGLCAAAAAMLYTGRLEAGSPVHGERILLDVIGATVIGGTSLFGGRGKVLGTVLGVFFLTLLDNSLNLLNASQFAIMMAKGSVILAAALFDGLRHRRSLQA